MVLCGYRSVSRLPTPHRQSAPRAAWYDFSLTKSPGPADVYLVTDTMHINSHMKREVATEFWPLRNRLSPSLPRPFPWFMNPEAGLRTARGLCVDPR